MGGSNGCHIVIYKNQYFIQTKHFIQGTTISIDLYPYNLEVKPVISVKNQEYDNKWTFERILLTEDRYTISIVLLRY